MRWAIRPSCYACPLEQRRERTGNLTARRRSGAARGKQNQIVALRRQTILARCLAQNTFRAITPHSVAKSLRCSEGDPARIAFATSFTYNHTNQWMVVALSPRVHMLKVRSGLDGPHTGTRRS